MMLIHIVQGESTFINDFDAVRYISIPITSSLLIKNENMKKSFEVRKILEVGADKLAALQQTADDLKLMRQALDAMLPTKRYLNKKAVHFLHKLNVQL